MEGRATRRYALRENGTAQMKGQEEKKRKAARKDQ
jgi:hypothetical protein